MYQLRSLLFVVASVLSTQNLWAQEDHLSISSDKLLSIQYINPSWNLNPSSRDIGSVVLRNKNSGVLVTVQLQETLEDSSIFEGTYRIRADKGQIFTPQLYVPQAGTLPKGVGMKEAIAKGELSRKPFFLRKDKKKLDVIQIFDRKEDALAAYEDFQSWFKSQKSLTQEATQAVKVATKAQANLELERKKAEAKAQQEERSRLAELEKQRQEELLKKQAELTALQKQQRAKEAQALAEKAMAAYRAGQFEQAQKLFKRSAELDPSNSQYNFQYGVTQYKLGNFNEALVLLNLASGPGVNEVEKNYYMGLSFLKTKEYPKALSSFEQVMKKPQEVTAAPSAFYSGIIYFQLQDYETAKTSFEYVLDNSKDPKLDAQAEAYIEQIAKVQKYQEWAKKKFLADATVGVNYDSNVLLTEGSTPGQGAATDSAGYRMLFTGNLAYRPIYSLNHELMAKVGITNLYTTDTSFSPSEELQAADPFLWNISVPYTWKTQLSEQAYQLRITPGYESLAMNIDGEDNGMDGREVILNSLLLVTDQTLSITPNYITSLQLGYRSDASVDDEEANATKINLLSSHTYFTSADKSRIWVGEIGYTMNQADGDNYTYNRMETGLTYLRPAFWESQFTAKLGYYMAGYPTHEEDRADTNISLTGGLSKPHTDTLSSSYLLSYAINDSNTTGYSYDKLTLTALLTWNGAF